jgi:signal transduction histidine kinase
VVLRPHQMTLVTAAIGALGTAGVLVLPALAFAYRSPSAHIAIETAAALIALLAAYLMRGRYLRSRSLADLTLSAALGLFAATSIFFAALPAAFSSIRADAFSTWAALAGSAVATALFAAAALLLGRKVPVPRGAGFAAAGVVAGVLLAIGISMSVFSAHLPIGIDPAISPEHPAFPRPTGHLAILAVQLVLAGLFAAAAVAFTRRASAAADELIRWFAAAAVLGCFARLNYFLFPSLYTDWVYVGDVLRFSFYVLLFIGVVREIDAYQQRVAEAAVLEERRRLARDLHDGLAQELAFIAMSVASGAPRDPRWLERIAVAAERALDESRRAIRALTGPVDEPLDAAVADAAREIAERVGARVELDLAAGIEARGEIREALLRILREAVTNAVRHGEARTVAIQLRNGTGVHLRIVDDGHGFDPEAAEKAHGFGLVSMRERAHALGGEFEIVSEVGRGTAIEVALP